MKILLVLVGILNMVLGLLPLLEQANYLPAGLGFLPTQGVGYGLIISVVGLVVLYLGIKLQRR